MAKPTSNVSIRLDQWADGPAPDADGTGKDDEVFVNGNLNAQKAHYNEGDSIPYRSIFEDLTEGVTYGIIIEWDTIASGSYALDYLTGFNFSFEGPKHPGEPDVTPTAGINNLSSSDESKVEIPSDQQLEEGFGFGDTNGLSNGQPDGQQFISAFGDVSNLTIGFDNGDLFRYNEDLTKASIQINFKYTGTTGDSVVLAWGGHIASELAWNDLPDETVQTASDINGSPYHMRLKSLFEDGVESSIGNQDRSLSANAVIAPPDAQDVSLLADEDNILGGNNDIQAGDDDESNLSGTLPVTEATSVNFADLHLDSVVDTSSNAVTSGGNALAFFWDDASSTLYASTDTTSLTQAEATAAFKIQVSATAPFDYTFTLLNKVDHSSADGLTDDNTEDPNILIDLTYTALGSGGTDTGIVHVEIDDDIPVNNDETANINVDEDELTGLSTGITDNDATTTQAAFSGADIAGLVDTGADEPVAVGINAAIDGVDTGLDSKGADILFDYVDATHVNGVADGRTVFTLVQTAGVDTVLGTADDEFTYELLDQVDHTPNDVGGGDDETIELSLANVFAATDFDGDSVVIDAGATVTIENDVPANNGNTVNKDVDEDELATALSTGITDGDGVNTVAVFSGAEIAGLVDTGADEPVAVGINAAIDGVDTGLDSKGADILFDYVDATHVNGVADGRTVFTLVQTAGVDTVLGTADDEFTYELLDQVDHTPNDVGGGDDETIVLSLAEVFTATDFDGDSVLIDAGATVTIENDVPLPLQPGDLTVANEAGATNSAALGYFGNIGADEDGSVKFVGTDGTILQGTIQDDTPTLENLKSGGSNIYLFGFGTATLIATTDSDSSDGLDPSQQVFEMTLNPDGSVVANDLYDFSMQKPIDNLVDVDISGETADPAAGNPDTLVISDIGDSTIDALFNGFLDNNTSTPTTVNVSAAGVGVGNGQDFDYDPNTDQSDRMRIDFVEDDGDGIREDGEEVLVNRFEFEMNQNNNPGDDGDMLIRVYDENDVEVQITNILINGISLDLTGATGVPSNDPNPGGDVTATANGLGYELHGLGGGTAGNTADNDFVTIITDSGYARIDISGIGMDANKDTFDILLESIAIPTPFDITYTVQADLTDEDGDGTAPVDLDVTLDADGVFAMAAAAIDEEIDVTTIGTSPMQQDLIA